MKPKSGSSPLPTTGQSVWRPAGGRRNTLAVGYASVGAGSPLAGDEAQSQRRAIEETCAAAGLELVDFVTEDERNDRGTGRRELLRAFELFESGEASCLVVSGLERLSNRVEELASIVDRLEKQNVRLIALDVGLDTATPTGRLAVASREPEPQPEPAEPEPAEPEPAEPEPAEPEPAEPEPAEPERRVAPDAEAAVEAAPQPEVEPEAPQEAEALPEPVIQTTPEVAPPSPVPPAPPEPPPAEPVAPQVVKAFAYASVPAGADDATESLEAQRRLIERKCKERGFELIELARDREPKDGKALDRPGLSYLLGRIAGGEASCLVVIGLERLSRSVAELGSLVHWFEQNGVRLVVIELDLDTATPGGHTTARALASIGGLERERLAERTRQGLAAARAKRRAATGSTEPDWGALRKRIADMRASGLTLQAIADVLNQEGVPTQRGGAKWRPSSVQTAAGYKRRTRPTVIDALPEVKKPPQPPPA